jgi:hypothetical protein
MEKMSSMVTFTMIGDTICLLCSTATRERRRAREKRMFPPFFLIVVLCRKRHQQKCANLSTSNQMELDNASDSFQTCHAVQQTRRVVPSNALSRARFHKHSQTNEKNLSHSQPVLNRQNKSILPRERRTKEQAGETKKKSQVKRKLLLLQKT